MQTINELFFDHFQTKHTHRLVMERHGKTWMLDVDQSLEPKNTSPIIISKSPGRN